MVPFSIGAPHLGQFMWMGSLLVKTKTPLSHQRDKGVNLCGTTLLAGKAQRSGHSGMPGNGGGPEGPTACSALCSKGIFPVSSRPPCTKRRLSVRLGGGYSAFSAQFQRYTLLSYPLPSGLSRRFCGFLPFFPWTSPFPLYFSALLWYNFPRNSRLRRRKGGSIP